MPIMANTPVIDPATWEALRAASIRGVPDSQLAESFGVLEATIRIKRFRDEVWKAALAGQRQKPTETIGNEENETGIVTNEEKTVNLPPVPASSSSSTSALAQKVALTVSDSISKLGEQNRLLALQIAGKGLKQANAAPPDVQSWQDVKALMDIVAKASGMDQAQAVQVNVLSSQPMEFSPHFDPLVETDKAVDV